MAYNVDEEIRIIRQGQGEPATQLIPPNVAGHDPNIKDPQRYDPAGAKALLDMFGYVDRDGDGWRDLPDGRPLVIEYASTPDAISRQFDELWKINLNAIGVKLAIRIAKWPEQLKQAR